MNEAKSIADDVQQEDQAFEESGLNELAYDVLKKNLRSVCGRWDVSLQTPKDATAEIDALYVHDEDASAHWQDKEQSRKKLDSEGAAFGEGFEIPDWDGFKVRLDTFAVPALHRNPDAYFIHR